MTTANAPVSRSASRSVSVETPPDAMTGHGSRRRASRAVADRVPVPVIASGGVGSLEHLYEGIAAGHAEAVLAASIFHFGEFTIRQAKDHMIRAGLPMRIDP